MELSDICKAMTRMSDAGDIDLNIGKNHIPIISIGIIRRNRFE